jgi:RNA polymerase sporulation-specific sigma factor
MGFITAMKGSNLMRRVKWAEGLKIRAIKYNHKLNMRIRNYFDLRDIYAFRKAGDILKRDRIFEKILNRYSPLIFSEISKIKVYGYEFDDLKQEAYTVAFLVIKQDYRIQSGNPFWNFLRMCIRRKLHSLLKSGNTKKSCAFNKARRFEESAYNHSEDQEYIVENIIPKVESHENLVIDRIMARHMVKELKVNLTELEFKAYIEKSINQLTYKQITEKHGLSSKTIDNALNRVMRKISRLNALAS